MSRTLEGSMNWHGPTRSVENTLKGAGRPLEPAVRHDMAQRFGRDFFDVRVHDDARAAESARDMNAQAYSAGSHLVFAAGRYAPGAHDGRRLIAHELAHVAQQEVGGPASGVEERAEHAASEAVAGRAVDRHALGGARLGIHRQPEQNEPAPAPAKPEVKSEAEPESGGYSRSFTKLLDRFALDKDTLTPDHLGAIEELALSIAVNVGMLAHGTAKIEIVGHADTAGKETDNQKLGQSRADRVREALEKQLSGVTGTKLTARSAGESKPLVATGDNQREPRNRRVEVNVTISSAPEPKKKAPPKLFPDGPITDQPVGPVRPEEEDVWKKMEANQRRLDELNSKIGKKGSNSAQDVLVDALAGALDPLVDALPVPESLKKKAREGIRDGIRAGSEKACEAAIDATGASGGEAQALKSACKAALKHKPGKTAGGGQ